MPPLLVDLALWGPFVSDGPENGMIRPLGGLTGHPSPAWATWPGSPAAPHVPPAITGLLHDSLPAVSFLKAKPRLSWSPWMPASAPCLRISVIK